MSSQTATTLVAVVGTEQSGRPGVCRTIRVLEAFPPHTVGSHLYHKLFL